MGCCPHRRRGHVHWPGLGRRCPYILWVCYLGREETQMPEDDDFCGDARPHSSHSWKPPFSFVQVSCGGVRKGKNGIGSSYGSRGGQKGGPTKKRCYKEYPHRPHIWEDEHQ